jgi:EAL domain-containing protein (putative c-di-GMP-specific phosphodiesterase class I)
MINTSEAESAWLAAMCSKAVIQLIDEVLARSTDLDHDAAERLRHQLHSSLEPAVFDVVSKVAAPAVALQPIYHLEGGTIIGYEALARFGGSGDTADTFRAASELGLGVEIEIVALTAALSRLDELPGRIPLGVNLSAAALADERVREMLGGVDTGRLVIELTQQSDVTNVAELRSSCRLLQGAGAVFCVDGAGRGFFHHDRILELEPEMIKIDRSIVRGCDTDEDLRAQILGLVALSRRIGALSVGMGVERPEEFATLSQLGVDAVQGHLLGKPSIDLGAFASSADVLVALA